MSRRTIRAALAVFALGLLPATAANAEPNRVEYRYLGQGAYVMVTPARGATEAPYALTGRRQVESTWAAPGTVINTGQGRYIVPGGATR
jgi:hypothetical protein